MLLRCPTNNLLLGLQQFIHQCPGNGDTSMAARHDPGKLHVLLNGFTTSPPHPTIRKAETTTLASYETAALESPPVAVGWLTGRHNFGHVDFRELNTRPKLSVWGECSGCQLPAGRTRTSDWVFLSAHAHPLRRASRHSLESDVDDSENRDGRSVDASWKSLAYACERVPKARAWHPRERNRGRYPDGFPAGRRSR